MNFILVIDDEDSIRELLKTSSPIWVILSMLQRIGEKIRLLNRDCKYGAVITNIEC